MAEPTAKAIIEARGLRKDYGSTVAVRDVSFRIARGEVVGFLGPNGAGKSTTMKMLTGFLRPTSGAAVVGGIEVERDPLEARRRVGYLPENAPLYDDMMVVDFLGFVGELRGLSGERLHERLRTTCERCGLGSVLGKDIGQLSKGFRQRVGLAQALLHDPDVLILDEPTTGLDPNQIVEIRDLIRELGRDKTILLSTHILPEVQTTCGRAIIIHEGRLVADDATTALTAADGGARIRVEVASGDGVDAARAAAWLRSVPGVASVAAASGETAGALAFDLRAEAGADPRAGLFRGAVEAGLVLVELHREHVSLEETFRQLTAGTEGGHA